MKIVMALFGVAALSACAQSSPEPAPRQYRIEAEGAPTTSDRNYYAYDDSVSLSKFQKYKITAMSGPQTPVHYLIAQIIRKNGSKIAATDDATLIPIKSGSGSWECGESFINVKKAQEEAVPDPTCSFKLIGYLDATGGASLAK